MCGFVAIMGKEKLCDDFILNKMRDQLIHRGPDDSRNWRKQYSNGSISLAFRRLSIIDLSNNGSQPMTENSDQYTIVFNGEIYNYIPLRNILLEKGYFFKSNTDTEVILNGFIEWGYDVLNFIEGMYTFIIWDDKEQKAFIARDRFGEKPLYWSNYENTFIFASEAKAILSHPKIKIELNDSFINKLEGSTNYSSSETIFKNIFQFLPGHLSIFDLKKEKISTHKYWFPELNNTKKYFFRENQIFREEIKNLLNNSIDSIFLGNSDVKSALLLSGGIDSTIIAAIINSKGKKLDTFSAIFKGFNNDESSYINKIIKNLGINNYSIKPSVENLIESFTDMHWHIENIISSPSFFLEWELCKIAKEKGFKILLTGQGSDEIFSGYKEAINLIKRKKGSKDLYKKFNIYENIYNFNILNLINKYKSIHKAYLEFDICKLSLPSNLKFSDKNGMAHSIELRQPFLNNQLCEAAFKIPSNNLVKNKYGKNIIREIAKQYPKIPNEIISNKHKIGFEMPFEMLNANYKYQNWVTHKLKSNAFKNLLPNQYQYINKYLNNKNLYSKRSFDLTFYYLSLSELSEMFDNSSWTK